MTSHQSGEIASPATTSATPGDSAEIAVLKQRLLKSAGKRNHRIRKIQHDPQTGGFVLLGLPSWRAKDDDSETAWFHRPRQINRYAWSEPVTSAHEEARLLIRLRELIAAEKAAKVAPHTLTVGQIIVRTYGATMRKANFYHVAAIDSPRTAMLQELSQIMVSGDWMSGEVVPDLATPPTTKPVRTKITMKNGYPAFDDDKLGYSMSRVWKGEPIRVYCD